MGFLQLTITWYKIHYAVEQATIWGHPKQNKLIQSSILMNVSVL